MLNFLGECPEKNNAQQEVKDYTHVYKDYGLENIYIVILAH